MSVAIIGRCDGGGLAALTREVHRHVRPARTLLLDLEEQGRGACTPDDYQAGGTDVFRCMFKGGIADRAIDWLTAEGVDTIWSAETFYDDRILRASHGNGIRSVVYAMPELAPWSSDSSAVWPRTITTPTSWRMDLMPPNTAVLPMPVARDRLPYIERKQVRHLYHVAGYPLAPRAMLDRNGTEMLLAALPFVTSEGLRLTIRAGAGVVVPDTKVDVEVVSDPVIDYWESYPADIDLLVLPRRYGGLSLPVQECASLGVPSLMLQTDPYAQTQFVHTIPATGSSLARMKGGRVPVQDADPRALAHAIDFLVDHPEQHHTASIEAGVWAESAAWDGPLGARWQTVLDA